MAKARSPNYPMLDFGAALQAARKAYDKDHRNKMSRGTLAKHLGHESLSGPAFGKIGALRAYGLIDGNGDELRITDDAVHALMAPEGSPERAAAMSQMAMRPKLFQEIRKDFPGVVSLDNLKFWLIKRHFVPEAAEKAAKVYLASMRLVEGGVVEYDSPEEQPESQPVTTQVREPRHQPPAPRPGIPTFSMVGEGLRQEVITLDEGDVTITFPADLSPDSFDDLKDHLDLFVKKMQRRAAKAVAENDEAAN